jgi:hypothetical protein
MQVINAPTALETARSAALKWVSQRGSKSVAFLDQGRPSAGGHGPVFLHTNF